MNYSANTLARASLVRYWKHGDAVGTNGANSVLDSKFGPGATNGTTMPPGAGASVAFGLAPLLPGDPATSAAYDGVDDFLDTNYRHNYATGFTWTGWIKTTDAIGGLYGDLAVAAIDSGTQAYISAGLVNFELFPAPQGIASTIAVNDNLLHMICVTWDGAAAGPIRIYVDGVLNSSGTRNGNLIGTATREMILGDLQDIGGIAPAPNPHGGFYLSSAFGHVSIDNAALTGPQISAIYSDGITPAPPTARRGGAALDVFEALGL